MKTDQEYIKEGVELADGFSLISEGVIHIEGSGSFVMGLSWPKWFKAALAAQLTEQVDATDYRLDIGPTGTVLYELQGGMFESPGLNSDRAMNTIKVVIDSKVIVK